MRKRLERASLISLCAIAAIYLFLPVKIFAAEKKTLEANFGPAKITPHLAFSTEYFSNIYLTDKNKKGSLVQKVSPGLSVKIPLERLYLVTDILSQYNYMNQTHKHTWEYEGRQLIRYDLSKATSVGASYNYSRGDFFDALPDQQYDLAQTQAMLSHEFSPRLKFTLLGNREEYGTHIKGGKSIYSDYTQYDGGFNLTGKLTPATTLGASYLYADRSFHDAAIKNYQTQNGSFSITHKITPRTSLGANVGYQFRDYKTGKNASGISYGSNLQMILSKVSTLNIDYSHDFQDTFYPIDQNELRNPFVTNETLSDQLADNYRYLITDSFGASLRYNLTERDMVTVSGRFLRMTSDQGLGAFAGTKLKESDYYSGMDYAHKFAPWLSVNIKGSYGALTSNVREKYNYYTGSGGVVISF